MNLNPWGAWVVLPQAEQARGWVDSLNPLLSGPGLGGFSTQQHYFSFNFLDVN
jgi:hypothetical protein